MVKSVSGPKTGKITLKRHAQASNSNCGPAVVQMLLGFFGIKTTQKRIVSEAKAQKTIKAFGTRVDQLGLAVEKISPKYTLVYKNLASLKDIDCLVNQYHLPVAVEWQGLFGYRISPKTGRRLQINDSHYAIVIKLDTCNQKVTLADPFRTFFRKDRIFTFEQFLKRWWDLNPVIFRKDKIKVIRDERLFFLVLPKKHPAISKVDLSESYLYTKGLH